LKGLGTLRWVKLHPWRQLCDLCGSADPLCLPDQIVDDRGRGARYTIGHGYGRGHGRWIGIGIGIGCGSGRGM